MRIQRKRAIIMATAAFAWGLAGCEELPQNTRDAGAFQSIVQGDPTLDDTSVITKGPYLHAPSEGTVTINWETADPSTSRISFGPEGGTEQEVTGITYQQLPSTEDPLLAGLVPDSYQHEVVLNGLQPGVTYSYRVLSAIGAQGGTFVGPPAVGSPTTFIVYGDSRTGHEEHGNVVSGIMELASARGLPHFVINTGDMTMTGGVDDEWVLFFQIEAPLISAVPIIPIFGNHDFLLGRTSFEAYFNPPPTSSSDSDRYFSADIGNVHIVVVDAHTLDMEPHEDWVEADLAASTAPYKIAALHPPLFTNSNHDPAFLARDKLVPIFEAYGVQLVVAGHNHCYEKFVGYGGYYITSGGGGAPLYGVDDHLDADNGEAERFDALEAFHFIWAEANETEMRLEVYAGDTGLAPVNTLVDCFKISAGETVTDPIPCD